ncbi:MAG: nuclear transport factor 2 family protein [Proteobacteria bacterium]|nr:nuclear transport factor 2 family protein [Pseudomonadota bacterium]
MSIEKNKQVVRQAYNAVAEGDVEGFMSCLTEDATYTFFGKHKLARTFAGKADIMQNLLLPLNEVLATTLKLEITNMIGEGDQVVMEALGRSETRDGGTYNNTYCIVFSFRGGKITAVREYLDTEMVTEVFGAWQDAG